MRQKLTDSVGFSESNKNHMPSLWTSGYMHIQVAYESHHRLLCGQALSWMSNVQLHQANASPTTNTNRSSPRLSEVFEAKSATDQTPSRSDSQVKCPMAKTKDSDACTWRPRDFIGTKEELKYVEAFVDEVGVWMDSLDHENHFSQVLPGCALENRLLWNALLACGAKHISLSNPNLEKKAECYFDAATRLLLRTLQSDDRDGEVCVVASVILHVYEIMAEKPARHMSHYAGARALIRERGWNAKSTGIGSACFWLSISMEVWCCSAMNWLITWDPDEWGLETGWDRGNAGDTELERARWVHRAFYIVAKVVNFRAATPLFLDSDPLDQHARLAARLDEWQTLKKLCSSWNELCPRSMQALGYLSLRETQGESWFPKIW